MKEIDTDSPVAWPAWCYTGYLSTDNIRQKQSAASAAGTRLGVKTSSARPATSSGAARTLSTFLTSLSSSAASSSSPTSSSLSSSSSTSSNCSTEISGKNISGDIVTYKSQTKRKSNSTRNTLHHCAAAAATAAAATATASITTTRTRKFAAAPENSQFISALLQAQQRSKKSHNHNNHRSLASVASIEKMLSERSLLLGGFNAIESVKRLCDPSTGATTSAIQQQPAAAAAAATASPNAATATAAAAAAYLYLENFKNEKLSPRVTAKQIDSVKDAIMESTSTCSSNSNSNNNNNNNSNTSKSSNSINSSNSNNNSNSNVRLQNAVDGNISNHYNPQQPTQHQHLCSSNNVKREQLSPSNNGEIQSMVSRSRSATPSSFRGTPPHNALQTTPPDSLMPVHNLSANLLSSIQQAAAERQNPPAGNSALPTDFSTHNYSEFMRSLAAKYNNSHQNNSSSTRRNALFDSSSSCVTTSSSNKVPSANKGPANAALASKAIAAPPPLLSPPNAVANTLKSQGQHQTHMAAAAAAASVSPFMTSFLSSLPFGQAVFPSLIDMSSTQALITLARAAKEAEIQNILRSTQQNKRPASSASASPRPSLTAALQQAAQFVAPTLFYSTQLQQHSQQTSRQSSPLQARSTSGSGAAVQNCGKAHVPASTPLDLSSQPPVAKRFKAESTSSQGSNEANSTGGGAHLTSRGLSTTSTTVSPLLATNAMDRSTTLIQTASSASSPHERVTNADSTASTGTTNTTRLGASLRQCPAQSDEVNAWTIDDVCAFVGGIDICLEYVQKFRDQCIDGSGLPLLTEDHLMNSLGMKLGPALKLRSVLAKKLGGPCPCVACVAQAQLLAVQALQTGSITTMAATARAATATLSAPAAAASPVIQPNETSTKATHLTAGSAAFMGNICSGPHAQHRQQTPTTAASTSITATSGSGSTTESSSTSSSSSRSSSTSASSSSSCNNNTSCTNINNSSENRNDTNNNTNSNNSGLIANLVHNSSANNDESSSSKNNNKTLKQQQQQPGSTDCGS